MAAGAQLLDISKDFAREVSQIDSSFMASGHCLHVTAYSVLYAPHGDGSIVSLWDAWSRFLRALVLASCAGPSVGATGSTYSPAVPRNEQQAFAHLRASGIRLTQGEPKWFDPQTLDQVLSALGVQNELAIMAAVGSSSLHLGGGITIRNPIAEIRTIRNFVAHKTTRTLSAAQRYMATPVRDVHSHLWEKTLGGSERFSVWANGLAVVSEAACA